MDKLNSGQRTLTIQTLLESESRICQLQQAAAEIFLTISARTDLGEQARETVEMILSTLETPRQYHAIFFNGLLACHSFDMFSSCLVQNFVAFSHTYHRFIARFDRTLAALGPLLAAVRARDDDRWTVLDAFVEPIRQVSSYRASIETLLEITPRLHSARSNLLEALNIVCTGPVQADMAEDLVTLRELAWSLASASSKIKSSPPRSISSISPSVQNEAILSLVRLGRKILRQGVLVLKENGHSMPVVVVLLSDIIIILARASTGMRLHARYNLFSTYVQKADHGTLQLYNFSRLPEACELVLVSAGARNVFVAASPSERRWWTEGIEAAISATQPATSMTCSSSEVVPKRGCNSGATPRTAAQLVGGAETELQPQYALESQPLKSKASGDAEGAWGCGSDLDRLRSELDRLISELNRPVHHVGSADEKASRDADGAGGCGSPPEISDGEFEWMPDDDYTS